MYMLLAEHRAVPVSTARQEVHVTIKLPAFEFENEGHQALPAAETDAHSCAAVPAAHKPGGPPSP